MRLIVPHSRAGDAPDLAASRVNDDRRGQARKPEQAHRTHAGVHIGRNRDAVFRQKRHHLIEPAAINAQRHNLTAPAKPVVKTRQ